jgi:hypothetical protein
MIRFVQRVWAGAVWNYELWKLKRLINRALRKAGGYEL